MKKPLPLPLTKNVDEMDAAVLGHLDMLAKKVERLTGFTVQRNDPASADFLMTLYAGQLVWNDINARVSVLFAGLSARQDETTRQCHAATADLRRARGELDTARKQFRRDVQLVADFTRRQLTTEADGSGSKTLLGLMNSTLQRFEARIANFDTVAERRAKAMMAALERRDQVVRAKEENYGSIRKAWTRVEHAVGVGPLVAVAAACAALYLAVR